MAPAPTLPSNEVLKEALKNQVVCSLLRETVKQDHQQDGADLDPAVKAMMEQVAMVEQSSKEGEARAVSARAPPRKELHAPGGPPPPPWKLRHTASGSAGCAAPAANDRQESPPVLQPTPKGSWVLKGAPWTWKLLG